MHKSGQGRAMVLGDLLHTTMSITWNGWKPTDAAYMLNKDWLEPAEWEAWNRALLVDLGLNKLKPEYGPGSQRPRS